MTEMCFELFETSSDGTLLARNAVCKWLQMWAVAALFYYYYYIICKCHYNTLSGQSKTNNQVAGIC
jgi:hypothetical protein